MIENLPHWINLLFICICILTIVFFYFSNNKPKKLTTLILIWAIIQSILAYSNFYQDTTSIPPRFGLVLIPAFFLMIYSFLPKHLDGILANRNSKISTFLHVVRFPIEIILLQLFIHQMIPELMTFEGRNYDIIIGITAPIVGFLSLKNWISKKMLLGWNMIGLFFVSFILVNGILSAELPFQQFGFEQPNKAILYFPFILLPAIVVPIVIWTHLTDIIKLWKEK